jgi:hypothetical protein
MRLCAVLLLLTPLAWVAAMYWTVPLAPIFWFKSSEMTQTMFYCWPAAWTFYVLSRLSQSASTNEQKAIVITFLLMLGAVFLGVLGSENLEARMMRSIGLGYRATITEINEVIEREVMPSLLMEFKKPRLSQFTEMDFIDNPVRLITSKICDKSDASQSACKKLKISTTSEGAILAVWLTQL